MDALRLIELIKAPETVKNSDLGDLKNMVEQHPYFGIGHILYLNGLKRFDADQFEAQINKSAVRIADRTVIYQMVKKTKTPVSTATISQVSAPVAPPEPIVAKEIPVELAPVVPVVEEVELLEVEKVEAVYSTPVEEGLETASALVEEKEKITISLDEIFAGVDEDHDDLEPFVPTAVIQPEPLSSNVQSVEQQPAEESQKFEIEAEEEDAALEYNKALPTSNKMNLGSFNSWLKQQLTEKNKVSGQRTQPDEKEIIEKFIQAEPKISKPKAEFFNPIEVSKRSVVDNESIVSETLAKIYADQGDYEKAISAYKKLSLEKPEKGTYFAALIYELELKQSLE